MSLYRSDIEERCSGRRSARSEAVRLESECSAMAVVPAHIITDVETLYLINAYSLHLLKCEKVGLGFRLAGFISSLLAHSRASRHLEQLCCACKDMHTARFGSTSCENTAASVVRDKSSAFHQRLYVLIRERMLWIGPNEPCYTSGDLNSCQWDDGGIASL